MDELWDRERIKVVCLTGKVVRARASRAFRWIYTVTMTPNGARGSIKNLRRVGVRVMIGHAHSPGANEGAMQVGTSSRLQLEYNHGGVSGWLHTHGLVHANGKRQLVTIINGKYRL